LFLFVTLFFITLNIVYVSSDVNDFSISPQNPIKGDVVEAVIYANPEEFVNISISYLKKIEVASGEFVWDVGYIDIPQDKNFFSISSNNLSLLSVTTIISGIPITQTAIWENGATKISTRNLSPGEYWIQISGTSQDQVESAKIYFTASTIIQTDENGSFSSKYNTSLIPTGEFNISFGNYNEKIVILDDSENSTSNNQAPIPVSKHTERASLGESIIFNASNSFDADGDIVSYYWDLGDNTRKEGKVVEYSYSIAGNYSITLTVVDDLGAEVLCISLIEISEKTTPLTFNPNIMVLNYSLPESIKKNEEFIFNIPIACYGKTASSSFQVKIEINDESFALEAFNFKTNETIVAAIPWIPTAEGIHNILVSADYFNEIIETNEMDNNASFSILVKKDTLMVLIYIKYLLAILLTLVIAYLLWTKMSA
jgi:hypothetical protein